ncbi:MAG: serine/threonine-protein kinase, partial [Wenzhouxiangella sp.]|nr:serine/threonine-protein kinase [Wenzhouxiangella sp.]
MDHFLDMESTERVIQLERFRRRYPRLHVWLDRLLAEAACPTEFFGSAVARTADRALGRTAELPVLKAGDRLGPWRVVAPAGQGGMGVVYRVERADGAFEMTAAIKLIASRRPDVADRLVQERHLLARLNHPGLSRLIDGGLTDDGLAYLVMEWVPGEDLSEPVRGGLDSLQTFAEIADALTHAHQRMVVHGDIKPGNVRISPDGRARLLDFGVARLVADEIGNDDHSVRALTPAFAAPELLAGQPATAQSDVWALGALLNWLLTGRRPAGDGTAPDTSSMDHPRAADLAAVIQSACADDPARRYPTVAALADEVLRIRQHHPVQARTAGPARRMRLWSRRNPVGAALALALLLGTVVGASVLGWQAQVVRAVRDMAQFDTTRWAIMNDQLATLFRVVAEEADNDELGARELLDGSIDRLDELLAEDDRGRAYIESMLGSLYVALQDYQNAAAVLRRFVGSDAGDTTPMLRSDAYGNLALAETYLGNHERALELVDQALV